MTIISTDPSKNILSFFKVMVIGFSIACIYHWILNAIHLDWPWNSFLFIPNDRFNDWHNSVAQAASVNPYYHNGAALAAYFPFTYILLKIGVSFSACTSITIYLIISIVLLIITASFARSLICSSHMQSRDNYFKDIILLVSASLISYPVLFALDRGNIDIWIALLSTLFVVTQKTRYQFIGLIALSIAITIKGYPAVFFLLLVFNGKFKSMIFCSLLTLLLTVAPLYFMWDGFERNLNGFQSNLNLYYQYYVIGGGSLFASSDPYNATRLIYIGVTKFFIKIFSLATAPSRLDLISSTILSIYTMVSSTFAIVTAFFVLMVPTTRWKRVTGICLIAILFPNVANDYKLCMLFPGLYVFLLDGTNIYEEKTSFLIFCLLMIPKSYFFIDGKPISMVLNPLLLIFLAYQVMGNCSSWGQSIRVIRAKLIKSDK